MKALSKTNKNRNDQMKVNLGNSEQLSKKFQSEGDCLLKDGNPAREEALLTMSKEQVDAKGKHYQDESKRVTDLSKSEKEKFLSKHSSAGNKQYQNKIGLA